MQWNLEKVIKKTYRMHFKKQTDMSSVFWRAQEFYESPKYRKKIFTFEEYKNWYSEEWGKGKWTYMTDWCGFNVPASSIAESRQLHNSNDFRDDDKLLFKIYDFIESLEGSKDFYLIGTYGNSPETTGTYNHELCHAMWATMPEYRKKAKKLIQSTTTRQKEIMKKELFNDGYRSGVVLDESNAYWSTGIIHEKTRLGKVKTKEFEDLFKQYRNIARKEIINGSC